jgi:glutaredoxin
MENRIVLTGISFEYNTTIFYEYNDHYMVQFFKCLLGSNVLKPLGKINLRYQLESEEVLFINIEPDYISNKWLIKGNIRSPYIFLHMNNRNLLDDIEEMLPMHHIPSLQACTTELEHS